MPVSAVLFDCDGVLVDSEPLSKGLLIEMLAELGIRDEVGQLLVSFSGRRMSDCLDDIACRVGKVFPTDFQQRYRQREYALLAEKVRPIPGIRQALDTLQQPCAVGSNGPMVKIRTTLNATGLLPYFGTHVYSAYDLGSHKPEPDLYLHAAQRLGIAAGECVVVEDSVPGAMAGVAAGMRVVGYGEHRAALEAIGAIGLSDMAQLPELLATLA